MQLMLQATTNNMQLCAFATPPRMHAARRALIEHPECIDWALLPRALLGLLALLCGNGYIVGINQIYDVDIDVVNKPFLPIASGEAMGGQGRMGMAIPT